MGAAARFLLYGETQQLLRLFFWCIMLLWQRRKNAA
nr:MAG TPA: hypothetical protein [Caudoviricetes sp.]